MEFRVILFSMLIYSLLYAGFLIVLYYIYVVDILHIFTRNMWISEFQDKIFDSETWNSNWNLIFNSGEYFSDRSWIFKFRNVSICIKKFNARIYKEKKLIYEKLFHFKLKCRKYNFSMISDINFLLRYYTSVFTSCSRNNVTSMKFVSFSSLIHPQTCEKT